MSRLRIALPMLTLVPGGMGGTETYARELVSGLAAYDDLDVTPYLAREATGFLSDADRAVVTRVRTGHSNQARLAAVGHAVLSPGLRRRVRRADLVHFPFTVPVPTTGSTPTVITLHDVQHLDQPEHFSRAERAYRSVTYDRAARRADLVITDSHYARGRIIDLLGLPSDRVRVAHLGCSPQFRPYDGPREEFVLYPARRFPHKNHARLIAAMELVRVRRPDLRLVLTGGGPNLDAAPAWVEQRGLVSQQELAGLYRRASCLAFPSLYEGFGMPPLEAMASGCPVAVSTAASLPEVVGDAGVTFDPLDLDAMARAIETAVDSRERLAPLGSARAKKFTWKACTSQHVECYRAVATPRGQAPR